MNMNKKQIFRGQHVSTSASQSTEFDCTEERINLNRPNIAADVIAMILPPN